MKNLALVKKLCDECVAEGAKVLNTKWTKNQYYGQQVINSNDFVDLEVFTKWKSNCNVLMNILGELSKPWKDSIEGEKGNSLVNAKSIYGVIQSLQETINNGYLVSVEDLIYAEAFSNLLEQAEYLLEQKFFLASAVLSRAVLEEKLRSICDREKIVFKKQRPTLVDYNQELYKSKFYSKVENKNIDYLTSIGNNAAHNKDFIETDSVKLLEGVKNILTKLS